MGSLDGRCVIERHDDQRFRWLGPIWSPRRNRTGDPILTMEPPGTAVRNTVSPGDARPSGLKLSVLFRRSYVLSFNHVLVVSGVSQDPHLEIRTCPLLGSSMVRRPRQSSPATCSYARSDQSFHVGVRHCNQAPSLMSGLATGQSSIISVVGRSGEMELGGGPVPLARLGRLQLPGAVASGSARSAATSSNGERLHGRRP